MPQQGLELPLKSGAKVAMFPSSSKDGWWQLYLSIPWEQATKEGYSEEETLAEHRKAKIYSKDGNIITGIRLSNDALEALLAIGLRMLDSRVNDRNGEAAKTEGLGP